MLNYNHNGNYAIYSDGTLLLMSEWIGSVYHVPTGRTLTAAEHLIRRYWGHIPARKTKNLHLVDCDGGEIIAEKIALNKRK